MLVGSFTDLKDNTKAFGQAVDNPFGRTVREMVEEHVVARGCRVEWEVPHRSWPAKCAMGLGLNNRPHDMRFSRPGLERTFRPCLEASKTS